MRTTCASFASSCLFSLPSSTSCSKFERPVAPLALLRPLDRFREVVELDLVALDVERVRDDALDVALDDARELRFPLADVRLGAGDNRFLARHAHRQDAKARRVRRAHHVGDRREIDLQRIDVQVIHADALGEPFGERFERERLAARAPVAPFLIGDDDQRMERAAVVAALLLQLFGRRRGHELVRDQPVEDVGKREPLLGARLPRGRLNCLLHRRKTIPQTHDCDSPKKAGQT